MWTVALLSALYGLLPFLDVVADGSQIFGRVESCFFQMVQ